MFNKWGAFQLAERVILLLFKQAMREVFSP